jgi:uncharacterized protein with NRDE domain
VCLILFAVDAHPEYRLVVAANRDEFFARPSAAAAPWPGAEHVIGGRDLEKGGTWLALARGGRLAALTNFRDGQRVKKGVRSRGLLVSDFVRANGHPQDYLDAVDESATQYDGFNLLLATADGVWHYNNIDPRHVHLTKGVHGVSNHLLDTPWPKVVLGKEAMTRALAQPRETLIAMLFDALREERRAPDHELPSTGVSLDWERVLSPAFIATPGYGTRASTVVLIERSGAAIFIERTYAPGEPDATRRFEVPAETAPA